MMTLLLISFLLMAAYVAAVGIVSWRKDGAFPESISATYYLLERKVKSGLGVLFVIIFLFVVPFGAGPCMMDVTPEKWQFLVFLAMLGVGLVGASPMFREGQKKVHYAGSFIAVLAALVWAIMVHRWWLWLTYAVLLCLVNLVVWRKTDKKVSIFWGAYIYWGEIIVLLSTYTAALTL